MCLGVHHEVCKLVKMHNSKSLNSMPMRGFSLQICAKQFATAPSPWNVGVYSAVFFLVVQSGANAVKKLPLERGT